MTQETADQQADQAAEQQQIRPADPCVMVIFGASGDLTKRMLLPSLYNLAKKKLLPKEFALVGCAIDNMSAGRFPRARCAATCGSSAALPSNASSATGCWSGCTICSGDFSDPATYERTQSRCWPISDQKHGTSGNYLYYLATVPTLFGEIVEAAGRGRAGRGERRAAGGGW